MKELVDGNYYNLNQSTTRYELVIPLEELERKIDEQKANIKNAFWEIGHILHDINVSQDFKGDITIYAEERFGFARSTTFDMIKVYEQTNVLNNGNVEIESQFKNYGYSQLVAILRLTYGKYSSYMSDVLKIITPTDTVKDISNVVKIFNGYYKHHENFPQFYEYIHADTPTAKQLIEKYSRYLNTPKEIALPDEIPQGQLQINDNSEIEEYNGTGTQKPDYADGPLSSNGALDMGDGEEIICVEERESIKNSVKNDVGIICGEPLETREEQVYKQIKPIIESFNLREEFEKILKEIIKTKLDKSEYKILFQNSIERTHEELSETLANCIITRLAVRSWK